jgi:hypothetical protein
MVSTVNRKLALVGFLCSVCLVGGPRSLWGQILGGMLNPAIDTPGQPFSYFCHPTDVIGAIYDPVASEVTPEGYVYTGFGELMFFAGNPPQPIKQRIKTLYEDYLPILQYQFEVNGVHYVFTIFGADLGGRLQGLPVNFIRVQLHNGNGNQETAFLSSAFRFLPPNTKLHSPPDYRFHQRFDLIPKRYTEGQTVFNPNWRYSFERQALIRDGRMLYLFPSSPVPYERAMTQRDSGFRLYRYLSGQVEGELDPQLTLEPQTPMGMVMYRIPLQPGQSESLTFKMPIVPIPEFSPESSRLERSDYDQEFQSTVSFWTKLVGNSSPLRFPEQKVQDFLLANTIFSLLAIDKVGDDYIPNVNKFQYHTYFPTDTSLMNIALDDMGQETSATKALSHALKVQSPSGSFVLEHDLWESFGHVLWAWGRHYRLTRNQSFLREVYPAVVKAMDWEMDITHADPLGLIPPAIIDDDAQLKGCHQTGQDIWTVVGIRNAIRMAQGMGRTADGTKFQTEYNRFWGAFEKQLEVQTAKTGGYIPPCLDQTLKGNDWDNLHTLYPEPIFDAFDHRVTATIQKTRETYQEGILPYVWPRAIGESNGTYIFSTAPELHYWHTPDNSENQLVRDDPTDQKLTVEDLYALLLHTSSTQAGQEFGTYPWSTRDFMDWNMMPDGSTSATVIELMRNMLVREYKNDLHLFSAVSSEWLQPGESIEITNEPTVFGLVSAVLRVNRNGWTLNLFNHFWNPPAHLIVPVPWFYAIDHANVDGRRIAIHNGELVLPPSAREMSVSGRIRRSTPVMSYRQAVDNYLNEYKRRYDEFLQTGSVQP